MTERERFEQFWEASNRSGKIIYITATEYMHMKDIARDVWQAARRWIPVEKEKIPLNENVMCGLWVRNTKKCYTYFDTYCISFNDEFEPRDKWGNYISEWEYDDFTHWLPLPQPPEESND